MRWPSPILVETHAGSRSRAESYQLGNRVLFKTGNPDIEGIPHDSAATVVSTVAKHNLVKVQIDATREVITYNPAQLRTQSSESRISKRKYGRFAEGERIRFTRHDKEMGVRSGDLGTVTRIGQDNSMTVNLDAGKTAEVSPTRRGISTTAMPSKAAARFRHWLRSP